MQNKINKTKKHFLCKTVLFLLKTMVTIFIVVIATTGCTLPSLTGGNDAATPSITDDSQAVSPSNSPDATASTDANTPPPTVAPATPAPVTISIGQYIVMGKYYDTPILWRCVDIDANGPLILADRILTIKPFDAAGNHKYADGTPQAEEAPPADDLGLYFSRTDIGSSLWEMSNMRAWLNSTASAGKIYWPDGCPPTKKNVAAGYDDYANEKGFLADGNFTNLERSLIKSVEQKSLLIKVDVSKLAIGGTAVYDWNDHISTVLQNYDTAYYQNVTDSMFLLDVKQINKVYKNGNILGSKYYIGRLSQQAIKHSEYQQPMYPNWSDGGYWDCWLRTPAGTFSVRVIDIDGNVSTACIPETGDGGAGAFASSTGVRPAFYLNLQSAVLLSGKGSSETPYKLTGRG